MLLCVDRSLFCLHAFVDYHAPAQQLLLISADLQRQVKIERAVAIQVQGVTAVVNF